MFHLLKHLVKFEKSLTVAALNGFVPNLGNTLDEVHLNREISLAESHLDQVREEVLVKDSITLLCVNASRLYTESDEVLALLDCGSNVGILPHLLYQIQAQLTSILERDQVRYEAENCSTDQVT